MNPLTGDQLYSMIAHARSSPGEVCGVLVGRLAPFRVDQAVPGHNVHVNPQQHYLIDATTLLHADDLARATGQEVVGFYHSHPRGAAVPSVHDLRDAWPEHVYLIVAFANGLPYVCTWQVDQQGKLRPVPSPHASVPTPLVRRPSLLD